MPATTVAEAVADQRLATVNVATKRRKETSGSQAENTGPLSGSQVADQAIRRITGAPRPRRVGSDEASDRSIRADQERAGSSGHSGRVFNVA